HQVVQVRYQVGRCLARYAAGRGQAAGAVCAGLLRRRLHHQSPARRCEGQQSLGRRCLRRIAAAARARRACATAHSAPVLLEERQVAARSAHHRRRPARFLGIAWLSQLWGSMERTALPRRLEWQLGRVVAVVDETPRVKSLVFDVPGWAGHTAGQHVDVRLTAEDGYQAERSYSLASPPEERQITLTIER